MDVTMKGEKEEASDTTSTNSELAKSKITITTTAATTTPPPPTNVEVVSKTVAKDETCQITTKSLKRCLSVPNIGRGAGSGGSGGTATSMTLRSAVAATAAAHRSGNNSRELAAKQLHETPKKNTSNHVHSPTIATTPTTTTSTINNIHIHIPRSNPSSREVSPAPVFNLFAPRARRYSASFSPLGALANNTGNSTTSSTSGNGGGGAPPLYLTPRVSQLRQEECTDVNVREVNHEREVHSAMQMSQSWEDLTLVAENWSCKSDEFSNPLQVALPAGLVSCSSPSPTSTRAGLRLPYGLSPSPTRRTFATRRSMSPIAMRPSQLGPVKRKFDLEEQNASSGNWSVYSPPPLKKIFTESRGTSPICQSPSSVCPSPDSGTYEGRITPKLFISKLCTPNSNNNNYNNNNNNNSNSNSSTCSSPSSSSGVSSTKSSTTTIPNVQRTNSSGSSSSNNNNNIEPMCIVGNQQVDEGVSMSDLAVTTSGGGEMQDDGTMMDDVKSETSSIGGCSSISLESSSSNSFFNKFNSDSEVGGVTSGLVPKHFFINKLGCLSGAKKYVVNHDHSDHSNMSNVSSTNASLVGGELLEPTAAAPPIIMLENKI